MTVANANGTVVRTLASGLSVSSGHFSVVWERQTLSAANVPDGTYTATVTSTDPFGNVSSASAPVTIQTPPSPCHRAEAKIAASDSPLPATLAHRYRSLFGVLPWSPS
jgi:hypothetical protein